MEEFGYGVFMWTGTERQSKRYGTFFLARSTFDGFPVKSHTYWGAVEGLVGKRVRLVALVTESRESGHAGDRFLNVFPSQPDADTTIEIGVGTLKLNDGDCGQEIMLEPGDGRDELWLDPRILYRLHDQTITLYAEETTDDFSQRSTLRYGDTSGVIMNGDGTFQTLSKLEPGDRVQLNVERLGGGMFALNSGTAGTRLKILK